MKRLSLLLPVLFIISVIIILPFSSSFGVPGLSFKEVQSMPPESLEPENTPPVPQNEPDWVDVSLDIEYFYNNHSTVAWKGQPRIEALSPYNPLFNWTLEGYIEAGLWSGNPGNATIDVIPEANYSAAVVRDFLNYTMDNYVRFISWPSLNIFNFTEYENASHWVFVDTVASPLELFNTTFHHVTNAERHFMDGFNATGIVAAVTEWRIFMQWNETDSYLEFSYSIKNATSLEDGNYIFRLAHALGRTTPLSLTGSGTITVTGPWDRMILNATPSNLYEGIVFPYFPIGEEVFPIPTETPQDYNFTVEFRQPLTSVTISRELSTTELGRGQLLTVTVTVTNTGDLRFSSVEIRDLNAIEGGLLSLVTGQASIFIPSLEAGSSLTMQYTAMVLQTGLIELPTAQVVAVDILQNQLTAETGTIMIDAGPGMLPTEVFLLTIGVAVIILLVIAMILYRFRRRLF